jgi:hypothetical protein
MLSQFVQFPISSNLLETAQVWPKTKSYLAAALHELPWNYDETSRAASVRGSGEIIPRAFRCGKLWNMLTMGKFWPWVQRMFWAISNLNMLIRSANVWPELAVLSIVDRTWHGFSLAARLRCTSVERIYTYECFLPGRIPVTPQYGGKMAEWKSMVLHWLARLIQCSKRTTCSVTQTRRSCLWIWSTEKPGVSNKLQQLLLTQFLVLAQWSTVCSWQQMLVEVGWGARLAHRSSSVSYHSSGHTHSHAVKQLRSMLFGLIGVNFNYTGQRWTNITKYWLKIVSEAIDSNKTQSGTHSFPSKLFRICNCEVLSTDWCQSHLPLSQACAKHHNSPFRAHLHLTGHQPNSWRYHEIMIYIHNHSYTILPPAVRG